MKNKHQFIFLLLAFFFIIEKNNAQTIPSERTTNWQLAGLKNELAENEIVINFLEAGGVPDGATLNDEIFTTVLLENEGTPFTIFFPEGTFLFEQTLQLQPGTQIIGESSDETILRFDLGGNGNLITATGSESAEAFFLHTDASKDDGFILADSAALFSPGDYLKITDQDSSLVTSSWAENSTGQIIEVAGISGDTILLNSPLRRDFSVLLEAKIVLVNAVENILLENFAIERMDSTISQTNNIAFNFVTNSKLSCLKSLRCNFAHVDVRNSSNIEISGSWFQDGFSYGGGGKAYGVVLHFATSECIVTENIFKHLRHSMLLQAGANGNVFSYNYSVEPFWTDVLLPEDAAGDMVLHGNYPYANLFEGNHVQNIVLDNSHGINGPSNTFFRNRTALYGIFMDPNAASDGQNFVGNEITDSGTVPAFYFLNGSDHFEYGNNVLGEILPTADVMISEASLYLSEAPFFYENNNNWPPIGLPNSLAENDIRTALYFAEGLQTSCADTLSTGFPEQLESEGWIVFPNPVDEVLYLNSTTAQSLPDVQVFSPQGKLLLHKNNVDALSVKTLHKGIYFLKIIQHNQQPVSRKFLKR